MAKKRDNKTPLKASGKTNRQQQNDSALHFTEYSAVSSLAPCSVIDGLISKLEAEYADFPRTVGHFANERRESYMADFKGLGTAEGEWQYLGWLIAGLLKLMDEAREKGHTIDATRFAFEAGLLWSSSRHPSAKRIVKAIKNDTKKATQGLIDRKDAKSEIARKEFVIRMAQFKDSSRRKTDTLRTMGKEVLTDEQGTPFKNRKGKTFKKWGSYARLVEWSKTW